MPPTTHPPKDSSPSAQFAVLAGGEEIEIAMRDGTRLRVLVRQLPISRYAAYFAATDDESAQIELLCDKPQGWSDGLVPQSCEAVVELGDKLNADFFARWLARRTARIERLAPVVSRIQSAQSASRAG